MSLGKRHTALLAGFIGNVVEWYDFSLYGYLAGVISERFFPDQNAVAGLIATYGIFAAGFLMRPLGSVVFGWLGDTVGRSKIMMISVIMMVMPTVLLGCIPTYHVIGIWAPVLLVVIRLVQGVSVGGEFSSSVTYLVETAPQGKRGQSGSWANMGSMVGMLLGSGAAALMTSILDTESMHVWGWRVPFLVGGLVGGLAIFLRRHLPQSEHFKAHHDGRPETSPLFQVFSTNLRETIQGILFASAYGVLFYIPLVYFPEWLHSHTGMQRDTALQINTAATVLLLFFIPLSGWIGDRLIRRTKWIALSMFTLSIVSIPFFFWLSKDGVVSAITCQFLMACLLAVPLGSAPAMFVELFPATDRLSGYSIAYNLGLGVIGGTTPMMATWLIESTGTSIAPSWLLAFAALVAFVAMLWVRDGSREPLP